MMKWNRADRKRKEAVARASGNPNARLIVPSARLVPGGPLSANVDTSSSKSLPSATIATPDARWRNPISVLKTRSFDNRSFATSTVGSLLITSFMAAGFPSAHHAKHRCETPIGFRPASIGNHPVSNGARPGAPRHDQERHAMTNTAHRREATPSYDLDSATLR